MSAELIPGQLFGFGRMREGHFLNQISTRLFFSRPSGVSFDATGS